MALAPLLVAVAREHRPGRRFLLGWTAGIVYWFGVCYWIQFVLAAYGGRGGGRAAGRCSCSSASSRRCTWAVFALLAGILMRGWWAVPAVAALWVAVEWSHNFLGFAWLALGNAGIAMSVPLRLAPYTGVYGLSFVFAMLNVALALAFLRRPRIELAWLAALLFIVLLPRMPDAESGRESAVLVQPNISEDEDWTPASVERMHAAWSRFRARPHAAGSRRPPSHHRVAGSARAALLRSGRALPREGGRTCARSTNTWVLLGVVALHARRRAAQFGDAGFARGPRRSRATTR